jgi:hypothetical protein
MIKEKVKSVIGSIVRLVPDGVFRGMGYPYNQIPRGKKRAKMRKIVEGEVRKSDPEWSPAPKVFGIGLSKTGTTSLSRALAILGYERALSWKSEEKVLGWPEFFYADAATDTPCSAQFEALYYAFEGSKFVYTTRDVDDWKRSIRNHFGIEHPSEFRKLHKHDDFWERGHTKNFYNTIRTIQIREGLYARHDTWEEAYHAHDERVHQFFANKSDDSFLEMDVVAGDGWDVLCPFLGVDPPDQPFPHANES